MIYLFTKRVAIICQQYGILKTRIAIHSRCNKIQGLIAWTTMFQSFFVSLKLRENITSIDKVNKASSEKILLDPHHATINQKVPCEF